MVGIKSGRTIGEKREHLETASERATIHKKAKRQKILRIVVAVASFSLLAVLFVLGCSFIFSNHDDSEISKTVEVPYTPTIEVVDEDATATGGRLTGRMKEYIGQIEADLRALGYVPIKAVIPTGAIREVDIYLDGFSGYLKTLIDRGAGVSAEDADRMIRYLASIGVHDFQYIDLRIDRRAYWR